MKNLKSDNTGFTLIELLIATAFFSFLLLFVTLGFVQINRSYAKGITVKTIHETGRSLLDEITKSIRNSNDVTITTVTNGGYRLCLSGVRYAWNQHIESQVANGNKIYNPTVETFVGGSLPFVMVKVTDGGACQDAVSADQAEEILDKRATVQHLSLTSTGSGAYKIILVVATKDATNKDLSVFGKQAICRVQVNYQFCDVGYFETVVQIRN